MKSSSAHPWIDAFSERVPEFLASLQLASQPGRFLPCRDGATEVGRVASLGFSCFALKTYYTVGLWDGLPETEKNGWVAFLRSFQLSSDPGGSAEGTDAFIDEPFLAGVAPGPKQRGEWFKRLLGQPLPLTARDRAIISETKQAIATLAQVGETADRPYRGIPGTPALVKQRLQSLDWRAPWGAGGQGSALTTMIAAQADTLGPDMNTSEMLNTCRAFFDGIIDPETGAYFTGARPAHGQLINGAMKVLTALDWLDAPVHRPEKLIDTCLAETPSPQGCHLVDAVYVLHRCLMQTEHRRADAQRFCGDVLEMVKAHVRSDGGLSYFPDRAQTGYYDATISEGRDEGDIHGTCLLTWALAMIFEILEDTSYDWKVIRP